MHLTIDGKRFCGVRTSDPKPDSEKIGLILDRALTIDPHDQRDYRLVDGWSRLKLSEFGDVELSGGFEITAILGLTPDFAK